MQVDSFVRTVRDMAAWAIVTPAAHIPVGGLQDAAGTVSSVTDNAGTQPVPTPDTIVSGFRDLLKPGIKVLTVVGAGQTGLWEDVAGRTGEITLVQAFRKNLVLPEAGNSALARDMWTKQPEIDAWLIWSIWQVANPELAQQIPVEEAFRIYRDTGVVLTRKGSAVPQAKAFVEFLKSAQGRRIFAKWGWDAR